MWKRACVGVGITLCVLAVWALLDSITWWADPNPVYAMRRTWYAALAGLSGIATLIYARRSSGDAAADFRAARTRHPRLLGVCVGLALAALPLAGVETWLRLERALRPGGRIKIEVVAEPKVTQEDPELGTSPVPGVVSRVVVRRGSDVVHEMNYTIDAQGRRVVPSSVPGGRRVLAFFGGSFTFGAVVDDLETLPHLVGEGLEDTEVHNVAFDGHGAHQMLMRLRNGNFTPDSVIGERPAAGVYVFIDHHVQRAIGSMSVVTKFSGTSPCFEFADDGTLAHRGSFFEARPIRTWFESLVSASRVARRLHIDFPLRLEDRHFDLVAATVAESAERFVDGRANRRFVFVMHPAAVLDPRLRAALEELDVEILDYTGLYDRTDETFFVKHEHRHPNGRANRLLALELIEELSPE